MAARIASSVLAYLALEGAEDVGVELGDELGLLALALLGLGLDEVLELPDGRLAGGWGENEHNAVSAYRD